MKRLRAPMVAGLALVAWAACKDEGVLYLTSVNEEPPGGNCADGGSKLNFGADSDADGQLASPEITASAFVCNGAASRGALVTSTALQSGDADCPGGGYTLTVGIDRNGNGAVDTEEAGSSRKVCSGASGTAGTPGTNGPAGDVGPSGLPGANGATGDAGPPGPTGADGTPGANGATGDAGPPGPTGADGTPGANGATGEAGPSGPTGADGTPGENGATGDAGPPGPAGEEGQQGAVGKSSLLLVSAEDPGANCSEGGLKVEAGFDEDGDTILDPDEIDDAQTQYVCNAAALCSSSNQCSGGKVCDPTHHCVVGECGSNADCAAEDVCTDLVCGVCSASRECDNGERCNTQNGECVAGDCDSNADCDATEACVNFNCGSCSTSADCDSNEVCETSGNTCVVGDCLTNADCSSELACLSFTCSPCTASAECDSGEVCLLATSTCGAGCDTEADCGNGDTCVNQACVDPCTGPEGICPDVGDVCQLNSLVACEWVCAPDTEVPGSTVPLNGSFETGDFRHWRFLEQEDFGPFGIWSVLDDGVTVNPQDAVCDQKHEALSASGSPGLPTLYTATDGSHLASLLVSGPGRHRVFQDVTIGASQDLLQFGLTYENSNGNFDPANQYFAVNVRDPADDSVLATLFKTTEGVDPGTLAMTPFSLDISAFQGQTVRIDFEAQIQEFYFDIGFDNVRVVTGP